MNGIPKIEGSVLRGAMLTQVSVGLHEVIFVFDNATKITAECDATIAIPAGREVRYSDAPSLGSRATGFLGQGVTALAVLSSKELKIEFSGGGSLALHDSNEAYESFVIEGPNVQIVV